MGVTRPLPNQADRSILLEIAAMADGAKILLMFFMTFGFSIGDPQENINLLEILNVYQPELVDQLTITNRISTVPTSTRGALGTSVEDLEKMFRKFDKNGDNLISRREFRKGMKALRKNLEQAENLSRSELNQAFNSLDRNTDGKISFEEFKNVPEIAKRRILPALVIACILFCVPIQ